MINFRLMRQLWLFCVVAEHEHFGKAARALGMSQPPLTEQIKILEQALKVKLFERSRQGTRLTPQGRAVLPAVQKFAEQMQQLEGAVQQALAGHSGTLTIGAITQALTDVLPDLIREVKQQHPHLTVAVKEIDSAEAVSLLQSGSIDLAFARLEGEVGSGIATLPLMQDQLAVALPEHHRLAAQNQAALADLADEEFVMFARQISPSSFDTIITACRQSGFSPRIVHEVRSAVSQLAFVSCGQGAALVPLSLHRLAPANIRLLPLEGNIRITTAAAAWNLGRQDVLLEQVLSYLQRRASSLV